MITINHKITGKTLLEVNAPNLRGSDLTGADLHGADLRDTDLRGANGIYSFGPIGEERRIGYAVKHDSKVMVKLGCFGVWKTKLLPLCRKSTAKIASMSVK